MTREELQCAFPPAFFMPHPKAAKTENLSFRMENMNHILNITAADVEPRLLDLPWNLPLREWPDDVIIALPRGISRHVVRFANLNGKTVAVKEISEDLARHEYSTLRSLYRLSGSCVEPVAIVNNRFTADGQPLNAALVTRHLPFSLPYRAVFGQSGMRGETVNRLMDALSVLIVRLHLIGFYWGDISLSNTLFRRDAGEYAAYLVDAETGELFPHISDGKREYDVETAHLNIIGELMDLQAGGILMQEYDAIEIGNRFLDRYHKLWDELTGEESFSINDKWRVDQRIQRLNELGFDVAELKMTADINGTTMSIRPRVVDAGHYSRRLMRLTGLDVEEAQARRMINDMKQYRVLSGNQDTNLAIVAHEWMQNVYEPTIRAIPRELRGKLEPAQIFHEVLEHRWYISEKAGHDVSMQEAIDSYINQILKNRPDEAALLGQSVGEKPEPDEDWSGYLA